MTAAWQQRVEGTWFGCPGVYLPDGQLAGHLSVERAIEGDDGGRARFLVRSEPRCSGPLRERFAVGDLVLRVADAGALRVYEGRDFHGFGEPHGTTLVGRDYIVPWGVETEIAVQLLPDGREQVYSALCYQGPALLGAIWGRYVLVRGDEPFDRAAFEAAEQVANAALHRLDPHAPHQWTGALEVTDAEGAALGSVPVRLEHKPLGPGRTAVALDAGGALDLRYRAEVRADGPRHSYDGPEAHGNGLAYGRAAFTSLHLPGAVRVAGREVQLDGGRRLAVVWQVFRGSARHRVAAGVLEAAALEGAA
jgi:hypothetical protein